MDQQTIALYDQNAATFVMAWDQQCPTIVYQMIGTFFHQAGLTLDIGCGSGRDLQWLINQGFDARGVDASQGLIHQSKGNHPNLDIKHDALPGLKSVEDNSCDNLLCSAVLMHLPEAQIVEACLNMMRVIKKGGTIIVTIRDSQESAERENDGRLFTSLHPQQLACIFESLGAKILEIRTDPSPHHSVPWHTLVARKQSNLDLSGLPKIQEIITRDRKTSTYKLALVRSLAKMAALESKSVKWSEDRAAVPLKRIAMWWLRFYWRFVSGESLGRQIHQNRELGFKKDIERLQNLTLSLSDIIIASESSVGPTQDQRTNRVYSEILGPLENAQNSIMSTIKKGPLTHIGEIDGDFSFFSSIKIGGEPYLTLPIQTWREFSRFHHWIDQATILEWAALIQRFTGNDDGIGKWVSDLMESCELDTRDTMEVRKIVINQSLITCTWSAKTIGEFEVDHVIPWSLLQNNDLWNLLPADKSINGNKSDKVPTAKAILESQDNIFNWWDIYLKHWPVRFSTQVKRALGASPGPNDQTWRNMALTGLIELAERTAYSRGAERWEPIKDSSQKRSA